MATVAMNVTDEQREKKLAAAKKQVRLHGCPRTDLVMPALTWDRHNGVPFIVRRSWRSFSASTMS